MANDIDSNHKLRPIERGKFYNRRPIFQGGETSASGKRGIRDLSINNNTIFARHRTNVSLAYPRRFHISSAGVFADVYRYRIYTPSLSPRDTLNVDVDTAVDTGTVDIRVSTPGDSDSVTGVGTTSSSLSMVGDSGQYSTLLVEAKTNSGATANIDNLSVYLAETTTAPASAWTANGFRPINTVSADEPYTVQMAQDLAQSCNTFFCEFVQHPVLWCMNLENGTPANDAYYASTPDWDELDRFIYFPSPGVDYLNVYMNGYTASWSSGNAGAGFRMYFERHLDDIDPGPIAFLANTAAEPSWDDGDWMIDGAALKVPPGPGPFYIRFEGRRDQFTGNAGVVTALSIVEKVPTL